jgi:copper chaperone
MNQLILRSADIHCDTCAANVKRAVGAVSGVGAVEVDVESKTVRVEFEEPATEAAIEAAMDEAGFEVEAAK